MLTGITAQDITTETETGGEALSGRVHPSYQYIMSQKPGASFTTQDIATALAIMGTIGANIGSMTGFLNVYLQPSADGGTRLTTGPKYTYRRGLLVPQRLSIPHGGQATMDCKIVGTWDGTNDPLILSASVTLPTFSEVQALTLGPVVLAGVTLLGVTGVDVDFGVNVVTEAYNGSIWPYSAYIQTQAPTITLKGIDPTWFNANVVPLLGRATSHANTSIWLRRRLSGSTFYPDATAVHCKLTTASLSHVGNVGTESTVMLKSFHDGTNYPLLATYNTAIT